MSAANRLNTSAGHLGKSENVKRYLAKNDDDGEPSIGSF